MLSTHEKPKTIMTWKKLIGFFCVLLVTILAIAEIGIRVFYWIDDRPMPVADISLNNEREWAKTHIREGKAILSADITYDPDTEWKNAPNLNNPGEQTNSEGTRHRKEFSKHPIPGRKRLIFVGDSYTYGFLVKNEEAFATVLANKYLPRWDVQPRRYMLLDHSEFAMEALSYIIGPWPHTQDSTRPKPPFQSFSGVLTAMPESHAQPR